MGDVIVWLGAGAGNVGLGGLGYITSSLFLWLIKLTSKHLLFSVLKDYRLRPLFGISNHPRLLSPGFILSFRATPNTQHPVLPRTKPTTLQTLLHTSKSPCILLTSSLLPVLRPPVSFPSTLSPTSPLPSPTRTTLPQPIPLCQPPNVSQLQYLIVAWPCANHRIASYPNGTTPSAPSVPSVTPTEPTGVTGAAVPQKIQGSLAALMVLVAAGVLVL